MKLDSVLSVIDGFEGLSPASTRTYRRRIAKLYTLNEALDDHDKTVKALDGVSNVNTQKDLYGVILAVAKRSDAFKQWVGEEALAVYLKHLKEGNEKAVKQMEKATGDSRSKIPSITTLMEALPSIEEKLGATSSMFLAAYLQINVIGLRDDLGRVRIVSKFNPKWPKQYVKSNGRLYISEFKTSKTYDPYDIKLDKGARTVINAVLKRFPERKWLVTETESAGDLVRRAFKKVGMSVSVNTVRHAQVSAMLDKNPNDIPAVQRTAERFKHSEEVHRKYYRKTE